MNDWHKDHKKAIAEKWTQRPLVMARKQELLTNWATGRLGINALCRARAHAEQELADARAEIERLKHQLDDESMRADGMTTAHAEAGAKNYRQQELIEQMREALAVACLYEMSSAHMETIDAALSAAERGEK